MRYDHWLRCRYVIERDKGEGPKYPNDLDWSPEFPVIGFIHFEPHCYGLLTTTSYYSSIPMVEPETCEYTRRKGLCPRPELSEKIGDEYVPRFVKYGRRNLEEAVRLRRRLHPAIIGLIMAFGQDYPTYLQGIMMGRFCRFSLNVSERVEVIFKKPQVNVSKPHLTYEPTPQTHSFQGHDIHFVMGIDSSPNQRL